MDQRIKLVVEILLVFSRWRSNRDYTKVIIYFLWYVFMHFKLDLYKLSILKFKNYVKI